jgi:bifunctional DNA-binding transcriptional regulator/antitoxin component of YhaV-PrlF toxin-antitoxin module
MKLIKHYTTKDKKYYKYEVVIPNKKVEEAGLKEGDDLEVEVVGEKKLRLRGKWVWD